MNKAAPSLFIDLEIVKKNIQHMADKARQCNVEFRPHFKTHQSKEIGRIFRDHEVHGITVSSVEMAEYFLNDGWNDITIAFPANILSLPSYNKLAENCELSTLVISEKVVEKLDSGLRHSMGVYIEIDPDYGRSGIPVGDIETIKSVVKAIEDSEHLSPKGFYCHAGHTYKARSKKEIAKIAEDTLGKLQRLKDAFPEYRICYGDTPSCSTLENFGPVDQISPGNFVFYDWMQVEIGACTPNEIAVYMKCPVIEKFEDRLQVLIHGGAVHFSKDYIEVNDINSYGEPMLKHLSKETYLKNISQEHGIIQCSKQVFDEIEVGELIDIFPIHSCLTANLMRQYHTESGQVLDHMNGIKVS